MLSGMSVRLANFLMLIVSIQELSSAQADAELPLLADSSGTRQGVFHPTIFFASRQILTFCLVYLACNQSDKWILRGCYVTADKCHAIMTTKAIYGQACG